MRKRGKPAAIASAAPILTGQGQAGDTGGNQGALAGLLMIFPVWVAGKCFRASTTFIRSAGTIEKVLGAEPEFYK